jgi:hypothetical protein
LQVTPGEGRVSASGLNDLLMTSKHCCTETELADTKVKALRQCRTTVTENRTSVCQSRHTPTSPSSRVKGVAPFTRYGFWLAGATLLWVLALTSDFTITATHVVYASVLLFVSIHAYLSWADKRETKIPVWALLCGVHFVFYGLAIFTASRASPSLYDRRSDLSDSVLADAMLVGIVGIFSMAVGRSVANHFAARSKIHLPLLEIGAITPLRIQFILILGIVVNLVGIPFFGTPIWNVSVTFFGTIPLAAFVWICMAGLSRKASNVDVLLAGAFLLTRALSGTRFGVSLGTVLVPAFLVALGAVSIKRRLPWVLIGAFAFLVLFLQPSKMSIRNRMSLGEFEGHTTEAMRAWVETAALQWQDVLEGRTSVISELSATSSRTSLIVMAGTVLSKTPDIVPYQHGEGYSLLLLSWVPRFLWPDKPTANTGNRFFQVAYGLTNEEDLQNVSIGCGFESEGYMNFGWLGIAVVSLLAGAVFGCYEHFFFSLHSTMAATAIGLSMLWVLLTIEYQLVSYLGGLIQMIVAALIVFQPPRARVWRALMVHKSTI